MLVLECDDTVESVLIGTHSKHPEVIGLFPGHLGLSDPRGLLPGRGRRRPFSIWRGLGSLVVWECA